jgi:Domain of unknown function (DUF4266)
MPTRLFLTVFTLLALSACALTPVQPWDRDLLAEEKMQLIPDPTESFIEEHIYFSKEGSSGGQGVGGGGCGCN